MASQISRSSTNRGQAPQVSATARLSMRSTSSNAFKRPIEINVLMDFSPADLNSLTADELISIFKHYDRKDAGHLTVRSPELERLARHVVERIETTFTDDYTRDMANANEAQIAAALERERVYLMPGAGKDRERNERDMVQYMIKGLDLNKDGRITTQEFSIAWSECMAKLFVSRSSKGSKGCTIL